MRFSLVVLGICFSSLAVAAESNVKLHESKLAAAQKWADVAEGFKGVIPGSVIKEFSQSVDGKPFPNARRLKYGIQLTQNNGMRVTVQFKSNGKISFNGKDWRFKPLESIDNQVNQLALFLSGDQRKAGMDLISSAYASNGADKGAFGLAALAFAAANSWKADACDEASLTDELIEDCTLMAVAMRSDIEGWKKQARGVDLFGEIRRAGINAGKDSVGFFPVSLKCPKDGNGFLELIKKREGKDTVKYFLKFKNGTPVSIKIDGSEGGSKFKNLLDIEVNKIKSDEDGAAFEKYIKQGMYIKKEVCEGSTYIRGKYFDALDSNADQLRNASPVEEEDGGKKSIESS
jgi:hypothetical protein